ADERATTNANEDDFPIQTCIAIVDGMEELQEHDMIYEAKVMKDDFVLQFQFATFNGFFSNMIIVFKV
ncbi:hypothetical protein ACJX0J_006593, partial [Zea mays]